MTVDLETSRRLASGRVSYWDQNFWFQLESFQGMKGLGEDGKYVCLLIRSCTAAQVEEGRAGGHGTIRRSSTSYSTVGSQSVPSERAVRWPAFDRRGATSRGSSTFLVRGSWKGVCAENRCKGTGASRRFITSAVPLCAFASMRVATREVGMVKAGNRVIYVVCLLLYCQCSSDSVRHC